MKKSVVVISLTLGFSLSPGSFAQSAGERLIEDIVYDVINRTAETAREEVRRKTGIDPLDRGYGDRDNYRPAPSDLRDESIDELRRLDNEYDRKIAKLEGELERDLDKAEHEFRREAGKEDKPEKVREKRRKLETKVDKAHRKFEEKLRKENDRYDRKREQILSKHYE